MELTRRRVVAGGAAAVGGVLVGTALSDDHWLCPEPVDGKAMVSVDYATRFEATTGTPSAGTDATAVEWFTTESFRSRTDASLHRTTVAKYGTDLDALVATAREATSGD